MSYPTDGEPRFTVGSITGYVMSEAAINGETSSGRGGYRAGGSVPGTVWYVYDRAYSHRIVGQFEGGFKRTKLIPGLPMRWEGTNPEQRARERAAELNEWDG